MVRLFYPSSAQSEMSNLAYEVIHGPWKEEEWNAALKKAKALFIGPGLGSSKEVKEWVLRTVPQLTLPVVLDADALLDSLTLPKHAICTPHRGEMLRLLGKERLEEPQLLQRCQQFSDAHEVTLILKGAPTWIFTPVQPPILIVHGDPGMATAGSGDVLTGLLAALLAQGCDCKKAAVLGVMLHGLAGEAAAFQKTSYSLIARDLIDALPRAFQSMLR
jgi:NAD(P)H-hydrate epimerase